MASAAEAGPTRSTARQPVGEGHAARAGEIRDEAITTRAVFDRVLLTGDGTAASAAI